MQRLWPLLLLKSTMGMTHISEMITWASFSQSQTPLHYANTPATEEPQWSHLFHASIIFMFSSLHLRQKQVLRSQGN